MTQSDPGRDKVVERLQAAMDQLRLDATRVEMWAVALIGFSRPIPDYSQDEHLLPPRTDEPAPAKSTSRRHA